MNLSSGEQTMIFLIVTVVAVCLTIVTYHHSTSIREVAQAKKEIAIQERLRSEAAAREVDSRVQLAYIERVGVPPSIPAVAITLPQDELNKFALEVARRRINSLQLSLNIPS